MQRVALIGLAAWAACGQAVQAKGPAAPFSFPQGPARVQQHGPATTLKVYAPAQRAIWQGRGDALESVDLCVVSTTGRFRLQIFSQGGGAIIGPQRIHYTLSFRDGAGVVHDVPVDDQALITIEGSAPSAANCDTGPNAVLSMKTQQTELLKGQAGEYFDRLRLVAEPL